MAQCYTESSKPIGGTFDMYGGAFTGRLYCSGYAGAGLKPFQGYPKYPSTASVDRSNGLKQHSKDYLTRPQEAKLDKTATADAAPSEAADGALTLYRAPSSEELPKPPAARDAKLRTSGELRRADLSQSGRSGNADSDTNDRACKSGSSSQRNSGEITDVEAQSTKSGGSNSGTGQNYSSSLARQQHGVSGSSKTTNTAYQSWPNSPANFRPTSRTRNLSEGSFSMIFPDESPKSTSPTRQQGLKDSREHKVNDRTTSNSLSSSSSRGRLTDTDEMRKLAPSHGVSRGLSKSGEMKARTRSYAGSPPRTPGRASPNETTPPFVRHTRNVSDGNWSAINNSLRGSSISSKSNLPAPGSSRPQVSVADKAVVAPPAPSAKLNSSARSLSDGVAVGGFVTGGSFSRITTSTMSEKLSPDKPPELPASSYGNITRANSDPQKQCNKKTATESCGAGNVYLMGENLLLRKALASKDAEEVKNIGNAQYKKGHFAEALSLYDRAISLSAAQAPYHANKAAALTALGRLAEAVQECQQAIFLDPNYFRAHQRLASLFLRLGRVDDARRHFRAAGAVDAENERRMETVAAHFSKCYEARRVRDWNALLRQSEAAIVGGADSSVQALALKTEALLNLGRMDEAERMIASAKKLGSSCVKPKYVLDERMLFIVQAEVELAQGRFEEAVSAAVKATSNEPYNSEVSEFERKVRRIARARTIGNDLFKAGKYFEASAAYSEGLELDPANSIFLCNRAACRSKLRLWEAAIEDCNAALSIQRGYTKALLRRAQCNTQLERWEDALRDYEVLKGTLPGDVDIARALFDVQAEMKRSRGQEASKSRFGGEIEEVYSPDQFKEVITSPGLAVVHFITRWSERCRQITPFIDELCKRYPSVNFVKVDIENHPFLARTEQVGLDASAMVSYRKLQNVVEAALSGAPPSPQERTELFHMLHLCRPDFESFLLYPDPKPADRAQVLSKEVSLPDTPPTLLDDQDVQIALKLSDDFHLNEIDCVSLLVAGHQEWNFLGREPLENLRLAAGLWLTERRALINSLQLLLRAVVLDEELDEDVAAELRQYLKSVIKAGLRKRLLVLIRELNREDPSGLGGPGVEPFVIDSRGALVSRRDIAQKERLAICQCLVLSGLIVRINAQEAKEIFGILKDCSADGLASEEITKLQIAYTIMFSLVIALISDALGGAQDSVLSADAVFRREFHTQVMESGSDASRGFMEVVRLAWAVFLMLNTDEISSGPSSDASNAKKALEQACQHDAFKFLAEKVFQTAAFQNDDADLMFMYNAYIHKLLMIFLSSSFGREKIKELKDVAMVVLDSFQLDERGTDEESRAKRSALQAQAIPFISLLELISEVYQKEPELVANNDVLWNFVRFAGEDHTSYVTLVSFLKMLTALACNEEGARNVYQLLQNRAFRTVSWQTLFSSLNVYEEHFRHCLQTSGALLPPLQEGDARALEAYLLLLKKVMESGNDLEKCMWFPEIDSLFKLLPFENVPPYLKGALRNAIATFVPISPILRDRVWSLLETYDLPLTAANTTRGNNLQQVYDMSFELNEVEARQEQYPSTISYLNLLNVLVANESDTSDKGQRYAGIFKFVRDQVLAPYAQRSYADPADKWRMVVAALRHIRMMLVLYHLSEEDIDNGRDLGTDSTLGSTKMYLPAIEIMKDLMSGKIIFRGLMSILTLGVNFVLEERTSRTYGPLLEEAAQLSLEIIWIALQRDALCANRWRPVYQPIDVLLSHDSRQVITLIEYIHYELATTIQQLSVKIMAILSSRISHIVPLIIDAGVASNLIEDYATCLEVRSQELHSPDNVSEDTGSLILRLLISNLNQPAPNVTHLLLRFDIDKPVERSTLQPKRYYSCLRVILNILESRQRPNMNASLHELGLQLIYELCVDESTSGPTMDLMRSEKYDFFSGHLVFACEPLPKREVDHSWRVSSLQQRAWLLKLLALELHASDMDVFPHRKSCRRLVGHLFMHENLEPEPTSNVALPLLLTNSPSDGLQKTRVLELLDIIRYPLPESYCEFPQKLEAYKEELKVEEIINNPALVDSGGVYTLSERGDRIIDLPALRDKLWQVYKKLEIQYNLLVNERMQMALREAIQHILRWAWKRNRYLEEQAAQLHMLVGWSQLVEISLSRRFEFIGNRLQVLFDILDATLDASSSSDVSLRMAYVLSQVVLTAMAKLQEQSFSSSGEGEYNDDVTYADLLSSVRISNSACHTILSKLLSAIIRPESSEALRRRQYATLLTYFHYCQGMLNSDISLAVMRVLIVEGQESDEEPEIGKLERDEAELAQLNFSLLKQDATALIDLVAKDAVHGSEVGRAVAFYVLEALLAIDRNQLFFSQLQSRGLLHNCFSDVSANSYQALVLPSREMVRRLYTLEAELALLLRVCFHTKKKGAQALFAMGALQHLQACKAIDVQLMDDLRNDRMSNAGMGLPSQLDRQHQIVIPVLRLVLCFTTLLDTSGPIAKGRDEVALEILEFIKLHHGLFDRVLRDDSTRVHLGDLEELHLVTAILSKAWPLGESEEFGFKQGMFNLAYIYFAPDAQSRNKYILAKADMPAEEAKKLDLLVVRVRANLVWYLHSLVSKQGKRLHLSRPDAEVTLGQYSLGRQRQPTLKLVAGLLEQSAADLETCVEEKVLIVAKLQDINELSRHEVDEIAKCYGTSDLALKQLPETESMRKRRYLAMVEMCAAAAARERQIACLVLIVEQALEILHLHVETMQQQQQEQQDLDATEARKAELETLGQKLMPTLEKLESVKEDKVGRPVKHIHRFVYSLKSQALRGWFC